MQAMKVAVLSFSGNVGKSTIAKHVLYPRIKGAKLVRVETINSDEGGDALVRAAQYGALQETVLQEDSVIVDIGASNVEELVRRMQQYQGSHEDYDLFVVPTTKDAKQLKDTINTIRALRALGVPAEKIRVVFNMVEPDETVEEAFYPLFNFHEAERAFVLRTDAALIRSEIYEQLGRMQPAASIEDLVNDQTDLRTALREAADPDEKQRIIGRITVQRLAKGAKANLDQVFAALVPAAA